MKKLLICILLFFGLVAPLANAGISITPDDDIGFVMDDVGNHATLSSDFIVDTPVYYQEFTHSNVSADTYSYHLISSAGDLYSEAIISIYTYPNFSQKQNCLVENNADNKNYRHIIAYTLPECLYGTNYFRCNTPNALVINYNPVIA